MLPRLLRLCMVPKLLPMPVSGQHSDAAACNAGLRNVLAAPRIRTRTTWLARTQMESSCPVSYTHLRAHETEADL
eukprot:2548232-Rhodomonas_salina.3